MTAGLATGLAVNANAAPVSDDFWECAAGRCWIDDEAKLEEADPGPSVPPKHAVLTRVDRQPVYAMG
jgi:hypothetical protein